MGIKLGCFNCGEVYDMEVMESFHGKPMCKSCAVDKGEIEEVLTEAIKTMDDRETDLEFEEFCEEQGVDPENPETGKWLGTFIDRLEAPTPEVQEAGKAVCYDSARKLITGDKVKGFIERIEE